MLANGARMLRAALPKGALSRTDAMAGRSSGMKEQWLCCPRVRYNTSWRSASSIGHARRICPPAPFFWATCALFSYQCADAVSLASAISAVPAPWHAGALLGDVPLGLVGAVPAASKVKNKVWPG